MAGRAPALGGCPVRPRLRGERLQPSRGLALVPVALFALASGRAEAQVPFTGIGLGYPVAPVDARAAALGSSGIALLGGSFTLRNPADLAVHDRSGITVTLAPERVDVDGPEGADDTARSRVSLIRAVSRFGEWAVGFGFGAELDQDFEVRLSDTLVVDVGRFPFEDVRVHDGGVSSIDASVARRLGPLLVGVGLQRLTGGLRQEATRRFLPDEEGGGTTLNSVRADTRLSYGAWRFKGGATLRLGSRALVGGSFAITGEMRAEVDTLPPQDPRTAPESRIFDMPASADAGGSWLIRERLLLTAAAGWVGWSATNGAFDGVAAEDIRWGGAGLELIGVRLLGIGLPVRVGGRVSELPFFPEGSEQPTERALTVGIGAMFRPSAGTPAELNLALEIGSRGDLEDVGLRESFRRLTIGFVLRS